MVKTGSIAGYFSLCARLYARHSCEVGGITSITTHILGEETGCGYVTWPVPHRNMSD